MEILWSLLIMSVVIGLLIYVSEISSNSKISMLYWFVKKNHFKYVQIDGVIYDRYDYKMNLYLHRFLVLKELHNGEKLIFNIYENKFESFSVEKPRIIDEL